jgi:hypothetical protein
LVREVVFAAVVGVVGLVTCAEVVFAVVGVVVFVFAVEVVVVVVVADTVVVVVVVAEHTFMLTVWGNGGLKTVPAEGLWLSTVPGTPPLCEQSTCVKAGVRPGVLEMAPLATACVSVMTLGTVAEQGPEEMTRFIGVFGGCWVPAAGFCEATLPVDTCCEHAVV